MGEHQRGLKLVSCMPVVILLTVDHNLMVGDKVGFLRGLDYVCHLQSIRCDCICEDSSA